MSWNLYLWRFPPSLCCRWLGGFCAGSSDCHILCSACPFFLHLVFSVPVLSAPTSHPAIFASVGCVTVFITVVTMMGPALSTLHFGLGGFAVYLLEGLLFHALWRGDCGKSLIWHQTPAQEFSCAGGCIFWATNSLCLRTICPDTPRVGLCGFLLVILWAYRLAAWVPVVFCYVSAFSRHVQTAVLALLARTAVVCALLQFSDFVQSLQSLQSLQTVSAILTTF